MLTPHPMLPINDYYIELPRIQHTRKAILSITNGERMSAIVPLKNNLMVWPPCKLPTVQKSYQVIPLDRYTGWLPHFPLIRHINKEAVFIIEDIGLFVSYKIHNQNVHNRTSMCCGRHYIGLSNLIAPNQ